jgi:hypothetical protein
MKIAASSFDACPLLARIPAPELRRDCPTARTVEVRHRATIYRQGEPASTPGDFFGAALASFRFGFFLVQFACFFWLTGITLWQKLIG